MLDAEHIFGLSIKDFLNYPPKDTSRNRDIIFKSLTTQKQKEIGSPDNIQENIELPAPLKLKIPKENLSIDLILTESNFKSSNFNYNAFVVESLKDVLNNNGYYSGSDIVVKAEPSATIWLWSKALATKSGGIGQLIDISPWVEQLDTNVTKTGGNFSLTIAPIKASLKGAFSGDNPDTGRLDDFFEKHGRQNPDNNYHSGLDSGFYETKNGERVAKISITEGNVVDGRTQYFFHHIISNNDILFISFDDKFDGGEITNADLPFQFFDMIGLVDDNSTSYDPMGNVMISITGRDCMKLLLEDGTFFFPNSFASKDSEGGIFKNQMVSADGTSTFNKTIGGDESTASRSSARFKGGSIIEGFFNANFRTIDKIMNLLIGHLSNIQICPDELFEFYGDRRTEFQFEIGEESADKVKEEQKIDYIYDE